MTQNDYLEILEKTNHAIKTIQESVSILNSTYGVRLEDMPNPNLPEIERAGLTLINHLSCLRARAGVFALSGEIESANPINRRVLTKVF